MHSKFNTKCEANGIPKPKIKWIKLSSNGDEMIIDNDELQFNSFTKLDASNYKCLAENELGKIEKTIKITYYGNVWLRKCLFGLLIYLKLSKSLLVNLTEEGAFLLKL